MGGLNRRAEAGLIVILIIVIVLFFLGWLINISQRECKSNRDCGSEAYCGSDFSCHTYPSIQKTVVQYNLFWPAVIIGIAIIIATWIFREAKKEAEVTVQKVEAKEPEETSNISEPYYKSDTE